jgi:hypothetical protein
MTIHKPIDSPFQVQSKYDVFEFFELIFGKKIFGLKTVLKYVFSKDVLKNHVFDLKTVKNDRF